MMRSSKPTLPAARDSLMVELGSWFRASATGLGIFAVPVVVLLLIAAAVAARLWA